MKESTKTRLIRILTIFVFGTLFFSAGFAVVRMIMAPTETAVPGVHIKTDYILILGQCVLGMAVMLVPGLLQKRFSIVLPHYMHVLFVVFLYAAIYLGEARNFYYIFPHWDTLLHGLSGVMMGALGFSVVSMLNSAKSVRMHMSALFVAIFAVCFAVTLGVVWEIYEYLADASLGLNMQKHTSQDSVPYAGNAALADTMKDLIVDLAGALLMGVIGYFSMRRHPGWLDSLDMRTDAAKAETKPAPEREKAGVRN